MQLSVINAVPREDAADIGTLKRRLHGGAVSVVVMRLALRAGDHSASMIGLAAGSSIEVDPLDLDMQTVESVTLESQVVVHRGCTSRLQFVFTSSGTDLSAVLDITLSAAHFDNLHKEVKQHESRDRGAPQSGRRMDLTVTGHLSVAPEAISGRAVATALVEDVLIFGWREEFGYDSDAMWAEPEDVAPAVKPDALHLTTTQPPSLVALIKETLDGSLSPLSPPDCPHCKKPMRRRRAYNGPNAGNEFWGCSGYPTCRGTRSLELAK